MNWRTISEEEFGNLDVPDISNLINALTSEAVSFTAETPYEDISRALAIFSKFREWRNGVGKNKVSYKKVIQKCDEIQKYLKEINVSVLTVRQERLKNFWKLEIEWAIEKLEYICDNPSPSNKKMLEEAEDGNRIAKQIVRILSAESDTLLTSRATILQCGFMNSLVHIHFENTTTQLSEMNQIVSETKLDYATKKTELEQGVSDAFKKIVEYEKRNAELNDALSIIKGEYLTVEQTVGDLQNTFKDNLNESERSMLGHVLSLMGVFSAITTIIMGLVISATSWLNGMDITSASLAFAVPSLIAVAVSVVLLSLVFCYLAKSKGKIAWAVLAIGMLVFLLIFSWTAWKGSLTETVSPSSPVASPDHILYTVTQYSVDEKSGMVAFIYAGEPKVLSIEPENIHSDGLHYCPIHDTLE